MIGDKHRHSGFTLIELLIVASIFSFAALLATTVFSNIQTTQRTIQGQQRVSVDGRTILETLARSVRTGVVNYNAYGAAAHGVVPTPPSIFSVIEQDNTVTCYRLSGTELQVLTPATIDCNSSSGSSWVSITPTDLRVEQFTFSISPASDPFRAVPRIATDCKRTVPVTSAGVVTDGFDKLLGACACQPANTAADCYSGLCTQSESRYICTNPNIQPQVTFVLISSSLRGQGGIARSTLQTTVVSRLYQR